MSLGGKSARRAQERAAESAQLAASQAQQERRAIEQKEAAERLRVQRKLIRGSRGRFNPFDVDAEGVIATSEQLGSTKSPVENVTKQSGSL